MALEAGAGANGGIHMSFSDMGFGLGFNNPKFSDRVLKIQVTDDSLDSQNSKGSFSSSASSCRVTDVHMSSLVLASQSPFFYKMFSNGMKESEQQEVTIPVKASEELALLDLLEFLYTHKLKANAPADLLKVLVVADKYQVAACVTYCAQALSSFPMCFKLALSCLNLPSPISDGDNTHLSSLMDAVKCFFSKNFSSHSEEALELTLEAVEKILSWDTLEVDSEDEVYDFALNWARTHYNDVNERRQVFSSRLCQHIRFSQMSSGKLKAVLHNEELEQEVATKMVLEALLFKVENRPTHADATSLCQGRVYKFRPVEVILLDSLNQECIVYSKLKKKDCHNIRKTSVGICTQRFNVWDESFYLEFTHEPSGGILTGRFGVILRRCKSKSSANALKVEVEVAVRLKTTGKFTIEQTYLGAVTKTGLWYRISQAWDSLLADDSEYFDNGMLQVRVTIVVKQ